MWQMGGFGPMPGQVHHFIALENEQDRAYGLKRFMAETRRLYGVLDRRLATTNSSRARCRSPISPFLAGPGGILATRSISEDFPNVQRWYDAMMARPAVKRGMEAKLD